MIAELPVWELAIIITVPIAAMLAVRSLWLQQFIDALPLTKRSQQQARIDLALYVLAGLAMALYNLAAYDYPFIISGLKLIIGMIALGIFAAMDLALEKERDVITEALRTKEHITPPKSFTPMTNRFFMLATVITLLFASILGMIISRDLLLLETASSGQENVEVIGALRKSIMIEILFVMGTMLGLVINTTYSWSRNIRMLFDNQTSTLKNVSEGYMDGFVPVTTRDEFGYIAGHTNRMIEGLRDRLRLMEGVKVAQEVQQTFLPKKAPHISGLDIAGISLFCDETGGDFYDFIYPEENTGEIQTARNDVSIVLGDVTGHGIGAAMLMASVRAGVRAFASTTESPSELLTEVNAQLAKDSFGTGRFVTLFFIHISRHPDATTASGTFQLTWANAGHDPAIIYSPAQDTFSELPTSGLPLGVLQDTKYTASCCANLKQDEIILIGTDGIWETQNESGEMFGKARVKELIRQNSHLGAEEILIRLNDSVAAFREKLPQEDDLTAVLIKAVPTF